MVTSSAPINPCALSEESTCGACSPQLCHKDQEAVNRAVMTGIQESDLANPLLTSHSLTFPSQFPHLWNKGGVNPLWRVAVRMPWAGALMVLTGCPAWSEARETRTVTHWRLGHLATWPPGKFRPCLSVWDLSSACPCALPSFLSEKANESGHRQQKDQSPPEKKTQVCAQVFGLSVMSRTQRHNLRRHAMVPKDFWRFCTHQWSLYSLLDPELQPHPRALPTIQPHLFPLCCPQAFQHAFLLPGTLFLLSAPSALCLPISY